jgi:NAD(P)-dependent dehydrogenase (short-subunit alcohol dehydrogenase family)
MTRREPPRQNLADKPDSGPALDTGNLKKQDADNHCFQSGTGWLDFLADHAIAPGMLMFSRFGYELSRRFWTEPGGTLYGKKVVLTGGTSGIGKAAAFMLAEKKAFLTIIARNREKAAQVQQAIISKTGNPHVDVMLADLGRMQDIGQVARQLRDTKKSINILINNAGALFNERKETSEGIEQTFATDLLGVFYLTELLKQSLVRSSGARIINVASGGMYTQKIAVDDLQNRQTPYNGAQAYARAKRGVVILTRIWAKELEKDGIAVHAMHPGWVDTPGIQRSLPGFHSLVGSQLRTPEQGADTMVWLALSETAGRSTGRFWLDRRPHETVVFPGTGETEQERQALWKKLHRLIPGLP